MLEGRWHRRPGRLFAAYVAGYGLGRLWVESLRIDYAHTILGALVMGAVAMAWPMHERRVDEQIAPAVSGDAGRRRDLSSRPPPLHERSRHE